MTVVHDFSFSVGSMVLDFMERLRAVLGSKSWDYCVVWWLSEDRRSLKWLDCYCAGTENVNNGEENLLGVSTANTCRDVMFPHPRTNACDLLAQLPSVVPLNSGIYAECLISNQTKWLNFSLGLDAALSEETVGTRVLIPLQFGLVELFVTKQFPEDRDMIEFITAQLNVMALQEQPMIQSHTVESELSVNLNGFHDAPSASEDHHNESHNDFMPVTLQDNIDVLMDHLQLKSSPLNFTQNFSYPSGGTGSKSNVMLFEEHHNGNPQNGSIDNGLSDMDDFHKHMMRHHGNMYMHMTEPAAEKEDPGNDNDSLKQENGLSNSMSENDEEDDARYRRRSGRGQAKNLQAERNRRKKLNGRLYALRSLVPNISKLDRASILGDAIEYVKELEKQVKDLENELEEHSDEENQGINKSTAGNHTGLQTDMFWQNGKRYRHKSEDDESSNRSHKGTSSGKGGIEHSTHDRMQQMEPQVEVAQLDGNEFFIRVFCEHKPGGFVRLMEALNSLGFEVTNVNSTRHTCLVSNIFKVERRDSEMLEADHVRDSLLELTRNPSRGWVEMMNASEDGVSQHHHLRHHLHNRQIVSSHHLHNLHN